MIKEKTILITGSSKGIGFGLAKHYFSKGYRVIINSNNLHNLKTASKKLNNCAFYKCNLTNEGKVKNMFLKLKKKYKKIDFLICNYGNSNFKNNDLDLKFALENNFFTTFNTIKYALPILKSKISKIVCISSICGVEDIEGAPMGYSIAKSSLNTYVKLISKKLAKKGIMINNIAPGNILFNGSIWEKKMKKNKNFIKKYIKTNVPVNSFGKVSDIALVCDALINSNNFFTTGQTFVLDGGQTKGFY